MRSDLDEAAARLLAGVSARLAPWLVRRGEQVLLAWSPGSVDPAVEASLAEAAVRAGRSIQGELEDLLGQEAEKQRTSPLDVVRRGVGPVTEVLHGAGVPPVVRDEFDERHFPDDHYGLAPASWADIDPGLVEPALVWGAVKARDHLTRRRDAAATDPASSAAVVAFAPDLMDQSRLRQAGVTAFVGTPAALAGQPARLVLVDLTRPGVLDVVGGLDGRVIGFHPHVDRDLAQAARAAGCDEVVARSAFFRRLPALVGSESDPPESDPPESDPNGPGAASRLLP
jgi:hypothetical protein